MAISAVPRLYKYMSSERLLAILKSPSIRFTQPNELNDPYECHLTLDPSEVLDSYRQHRRSMGPSISEPELENHVLAAEQQLVIDALLHYRHMRNSLGVVSLTEDPRNLLMWAHYGDEHRGAAVELDIFNSLLRPGSKGGDTFSGFRRVEYVDTRVKGLATPDNTITSLSRKSKAWEYEKEWRLIRTLNLTREDRPGIHVVDFEFSAIRSIYLGARFDPHRLKELADLLPNDGPTRPPVYKLQISPDRFELEQTSAERYGWTLLHRKHHFGEAAPEALTCIPMEPE